jgi:hypothetical protein
MGEHRTAKSKLIIDALVELGESLAYDVRPEWKIPGTEPHAEQIDIALFVDQNAEVPAFAIEVDSSDVPSSTSNAVKIFGKATSALIKPYFVFHIFLDTAAKGHRRQNTATLLSTQNYETYDFADSGNRQVFLLDFLDRHRAIRSTIDLLEFGRAIDGPVWDGIDRYALLDRAVQVLTPRGAELADVASLSINSRNLTQALARLICRWDSHKIPSEQITFAGSHFFWPLFFGVQAYAGDTPLASRSFQSLRKWQDGPEIIFSPSSTFLGLSEDFDLAIVGLAPLIFCVVAMLFQNDAGAARQLCEQLYARAIDGHLVPVWARYALAWCVIASIKVHSFDTARAAIDKIDEFGGLPTGAFPELAGPRYAEDERMEWEVLLTQSECVRSPSLEEISRAIGSLASARCSLVDLVARLLVDDDYALEMHRDIVRLPGL